MGVYGVVMGLAAEQHGALLRTQALGLGMSDWQLRRLRQDGILETRAAGLYVITGTPAGELRDLHGAVLLHRAVASHASAARLLDLPVRLGRPAGPEVSVRRGAGHTSAIATIHETAQLPDADLTEVDRIACTSPTRTVLDLSSRLPPRTLARLVEDLWLDDRLDVDLLVDRLGGWARRGRKGTRLLREILYDRFGRPLTESELEARFLEVVRSAGLPEPERQVVSRLSDGQSVRIDFVWPAHRLLVEVDGRRWHARSQAMSKDRKRDNDHVLAGLLPLRFTWEHVVREPGYVVGALRRALSVDAA